MKSLESHETFYMKNKSHSSTTKHFTLVPLQYNILTVNTKFVNLNKIEKEITHTL
jgi:hypothetical protein